MIHLELIFVCGARYKLVCFLQMDIQISSSSCGKILFVPGLVRHCIFIKDQWSTYNIQNYFWTFSAGPLINLLMSSTFLYKLLNQLVKFHQKDICWVVKLMYSVTFISAVKYNDSTIL